MRSITMAIFRLYAKKPPKSVPKKQGERSSGFKGDGNRVNNDERGKDKAETEILNDNIPDPLSLKFQQFIKEQTQREMEAKSQDIKADANNLKNISASIFSGQIIDLGDLNDNLAKELEVYEKENMTEEELKLSKEFENFFSENLDKEISEMENEENEMEDLDEENEQNTIDDKKKN